MAKSKWSFWDWVGYSALWVAALMLALDTAVRQYPALALMAPSWIGGAAWGFLPFILVTFAAVLAIVKHWPWRKDASPVSDLGLARWPTPYHPVMVAGKKFINERVLLDGHEYQNCVFENVTFVYNGTTPFSVSHNRMDGTIRIHSDNPAVNGAMLLLKGFDVLRPEFKVEVGPGSIIIPAAHGDPPLTK